MVMLTAMACCSIEFGAFIVTPTWMRLIEGLEVEHSLACIKSYLALLWGFDKYSLLGHKGAKLQILVPSFLMVRYFYYCLFVISTHIQPA